MRYFKLILIMVFFSSISIFAQEKYTKHTISKGETILSIAQKYKIKSSVIYELNPDCRGVLKLNSVLLIPSQNTSKNNSVAETAPIITEKIHEVLAKETLFGIAKQYGLTVADLNKANPKIGTSGLKKGQKITIPQSANPVLENEQVKIVEETVTPSKEKLKTPILVSKSEVVLENSIHEVAQNETKYAIAKQYGISITDLYNANPKLEKQSLKIGQKINIPSKEGVNASPILEKEPVKIVEKIVVPTKDILKLEPVAVTPEKEITEEKTEIIVHEVLQNQTKYAIAKQYGISIAAIDKANPTVEKGSLKIGQKINIPVKEGTKANFLAEKESAKSIEVPAISIKETSKEEVVVATPSKETVSELNTVITREVLPKETKFGIAKQYGISVEELEKQNPGIVKKLLVGYKLTIRNANSTVENAIVEKTETEKNQTSESNSFIRPTSNVELVDQLIRIASDNIGTRYRTGGTSKNGFDCSGLMCTTFGAFDIKLPRSSFEQANFGSKIDTENAQKGDLIFFKTNGRRQINHVGMVVEVCDGEIKFIHSSVSSGVIISSTKEKYYEKNFTQINRVLQ
jgi:cell wall-associated NlpC family hydrolase